jgi:hypothetical protein
VSGEVDLSSLEVEAVVARSDTPAYRHFWMSLAETQEFVAAVMTPLAQ